MFLSGCLCELGKWGGEWNTAFWVCFNNLWRTICLFQPYSWTTLIKIKTNWKRAEPTRRPHLWPPILRWITLAVPRPPLSRLYTGLLGSLKSAESRRWWQMAQTLPGKCWSQNRERTPGVWGRMCLKPAWPWTPDFTLTGHLTSH